MIRLSDLADEMLDNWTIEDIRQACKIFNAQQVTIYDKKQIDKNDNHVNIIDKGGNKYGKRNQRDKETN